MCLLSLCRDLEWGSSSLLQEPLQEWAFGPLVVKEEPLDMEQEEISKEPMERFRDVQQNIDEEVAVPGKGSACDPDEDNEI